MNPFEEKARSVEEQFTHFAALVPKSYGEDADPYTKTRVILMNGTEFESVGFLHRMQRHCGNDAVRRAAATVRRVEQQQQKKLALLKPIRESILEHTIGYEQLAIDLTAGLAKREPNEKVRRALDFALLEDFDHLYRFADLLEAEEGVKAENLVGHYTEITPGRPTIAHHRHPCDNLNTSIAADAALVTKLCASTITAAEQQTMNYYMNVAGFYKNDAGRRLYQEIAMVEEEHVTWYGSLLDPKMSWAECWVMHEYGECYLYWSCYETETDPAIRSIWEAHLLEEIGHLHLAAEILRSTEGKEAATLFPAGAAFPAPLKLESNVEYVRQVLANTVQNTSVEAKGFASVDELADDARFFLFQQKVCPNPEEVPSHFVIRDYIGSKGVDYRFETAENPIAALRDRRVDNTSVGRCKTHKMAGV